MFLFFLVWFDDVSYVSCILNFNVFVQLFAGEHNTSCTFRVLRRSGGGIVTTNTDVLLLLLIHTIMLYFR